jgi:hypothetical protein
MLVCLFAVCILHARPRVQRAPGLPCALCFRGRCIQYHFGRIAPRERERMSGPRHCEERSDEAIHSLRGKIDCFASLAMTITTTKRRRPHNSPDSSSSAFSISSSLTTTPGGLPATPCMLSGAARFKYVQPHCKPILQRRHGRFGMRPFRFRDAMCQSDSGAVAASSHTLVAASTCAPTAWRTRA